jgi:hypothetical protein
MERAPLLRVKTVQPAQPIVGNAQAPAAMGNASSRRKIVSFVL